MSRTFLHHVTFAIVRENDIEAFVAVNKSDLVRPQVPL